MMKNLSVIFVLLAIALTNIGGCNLYSDLSAGAKVSDDAIVDDVKNSIDKGLWTDAILKWDTLSDTRKADRDTKLLLAAAYAGRGGLDVLRVIQNLNDDVGTRSLLLSLMVAFRGSIAADYNDQIEAQDIIHSISNNPHARTVDENLFAVFVAFAKIGTLLSSIADTNNNGVVDPAFNNACTMVTDAQSAQFVVSLSEVIQSLEAVGTTIAQTPTANIQSACTQISSIAGQNICNSFDAATVTAAQRRAARNLIGETNLDVGIKVADGGSYEFTPVYQACP